MDKQNKNNIEEYLVYEDKQKLNTLKTTFTVRPNGAYLSLIGVDTPELLEVFKNYLLTFQNTKLFNYKSEQIIDEIIASNIDDTLIIDIYNLKNNFKIENIIQNFRFNRDFIPDKNIRIFILASNDTLDKFSEKAYDFVTFSNFYGQFKNNKFDFVYKENSTQLDRYIKEYKLLKLNTPKILQLEKMMQIIDEAKDIGRVDEAIKYLHIAFPKAKKLKNESILGSLNTFYGNIYLMKRKYKLALKYFLDAEQCAKNIDDEINKSVLLNNIGLVYKEMNKVKESIIYFKKAIFLLEKLDENPISFSNFYANLGSAYLNQNNFKESIYYLTESLQIAEKSSDKYNIARTSSLIAKFYILNYDLKKGMEFYKNALDISSKETDYTTVLNSLMGIGYIYKLLLDFNLAIDYYKKAIYLMKQYRDNDSEILGICSNSIIQIKQYLMINGKENTKYVITKPNEIEDKEDIIKYLIYKSNELKKENNLKEVKVKLQEAQTLADEINLKGSQCEVYMAFYDYYKTVNDEKNAQSYYNKANYIIKNSGHKLFEKRLEDIKLSHTKS